MELHGKMALMDSLGPLLIATSNPGKFRELAAILEGLPYGLMSLSDLEGPVEQIEEHGLTHETNALLKARHFWKRTGGWMTLGEDSGLEVDALNGELGVHTRRWGAGETASDDAWLAHFLERMASVPDGRRGACFVCVAALKLPDGTEHVFRGEVRGIITRDIEAPIFPGLPLSSVFLSEGADRVYAALTEDEKARISHRGHAVGKVRDFLMGPRVCAAIPRGWAHTPPGAQ